MAVLIPIDRYISGYEKGYADGRVTTKKIYDDELLSILGTEQVEGRDAILEINRTLVTELKLNGIEVDENETTDQLVLKICALARLTENSEGGKK